MSLKFNPLTQDFDLVGSGSSSSSAPTVVSSDPGTVTSHQLIYNTTTDLMKLGIYDTWVTIMNFREIMLTDESGIVLVDQSGNPLLETNDMNYIRG